MLKKNPQRRKHAVHEFNELISCPLCNGYLINPTVVDSCYHTYCRSCIVKYLNQHDVCPQCKFTTGKHIDLNNLRADDTLRSIIYKLVPGLYAKEQERLSQFACETRNAELQFGLATQSEVNIFTFTEPISLSLEYHSVLLKNCPGAQNIPILYLQCPGGVRIQHLKRFLRSKYEISPENKRVQVEVIYENEILQDEFSLVDVGYCYNWRRNAPMKFDYRIIINEHDSSDNFNAKQVDRQIKCKEKSANTTSSKTVTFCTKSTYIEPITHKTKSIRSIGKHKCNDQTPKTSFKIRKPRKKLAVTGNNESKKILPQSVKVIIARKHGTMGAQKKVLLKHDNGLACYDNNQKNNELSTLNDCKSLRSNDMRYCDYTVVTTSLNSNQNNVCFSNNKTEQNFKSDKFANLREETMKLEPIPIKNTIPANIVNKCDIVVSIPRSPLLNNGDDLHDNCTLSQLKTASSKKSMATTINTTTLTTTHAVLEAQKPENIPRLKIELNTLKSQLTLPKANVEDRLLLSEGVSYTNDKIVLKKVNSQKHSYDDCCTSTVGSVSDCLDLETYARNIGLRPIDSVVSEGIKPVPASNTSCPLNAYTENKISSTHKKRKKKHSDNGCSTKRRKLHAEIFSHPADECLKMKVKITASHNHRGRHKIAILRKSSEDIKEKKSSEVKLTTAMTLTSATATMSLISKQNQTMSEEKAITSSTNIEKTADGALTKVYTNTDSKLLNESELTTLIPESPPLPPSLFKTGPAITFIPTIINQQELCSVNESTKDELKIGLNTEHFKQTNPNNCEITAKHLVVSTNNQNNVKNELQNLQPLAKVIQPQNNIFAVPAVPNRKKINYSRKFGFFCSPATNALSDTKVSQLEQSSLNSTNTILNKSQHGQDRQVQPNLCEPGSEKNTRHTPNSEISSSSFSANKSHSISPLSTSTSNKSTNDPAKISCSSSSCSVSLSIMSRPKVTNAKPSLTSSTTTNVNLFELNNSKHQKELIDNLNSFVQDSKITIQSSSLSSNTTTTLTTSISSNINKNINNNNYKNNNSNKQINLNNCTASMGPPLTSLCKAPRKSFKKGNNSPLNALSFHSSVMQEQLSMASLAIKTTNKISQCVHSPPLPQKISLGTNKQKSLFRSPLPALRNLCPVPLVLSSTSSNSNSEISESFKFSLCDFRAKSNKSSEDNSNVIDLSGSGFKKAAITNIDKSSASNTSSLDAALNKIKPNLISCTVASGDYVGRDNGTNLSVVTVRKEEDSQKKLPESVTKEKLSIMFDSSKLFQSSSPAATVRPQNASVRNIPNPSALAFRNQQVPPILIPTKPTAQLQIQTTNSTSTFGPQMLSVSKMAGSCTQSPPIRPSKKPTTIDQVAANLNIRAAAAEANAAKAAAVNSTSITSLSPVTKFSKLTCETFCVSSSPLLLNASETKTNSKNVSSSTTTAEVTTPNAATVLAVKTQSCESAIIKSLISNTSMSTKMSTTRKNLTDFDCSSPTASSIRLEKITVD